MSLLGRDWQDEPSRIYCSFVPLRLTEETATLAFTVFRAWFGPPPAEFLGALIDGRIRVHVCEALGARAPKRTVLDSPESAVRWLLVAGHVRRAHDLATASGMAVDDLLCVRLGLPAYAVAPVQAEARLHRHVRRAYSGGQQCRDLLALAKAAEEANRFVSPEEIYAMFP